MVTMMNKATPTMFAVKYIQHHCKVNANGCWEWQRSTDKRGYGLIKHRYLGKDWMYTHRAMWSCLKGDIPEGMILLHSCDNPRCCNPDHLSLGTHKENTADMLSKGRQKSKLTNQDVQVIKRTLQVEDEMISKLGGNFLPACYEVLALQYKVSIATIKLIHKGKTWKHVI